MIWRLLRLSGNDATLPGCIQYSFIGYFYSDITPSATGGQPAQLYEMCKDGNNASDSTVFLITGMVYLGFGLSGSSLFHILAVQAAVYIAVDMLPVPCAQGITELMYAAVFGGVFGAQYVKASMLLVRGMDFYVPFCVSMLVVLAGHGVSYVRRQRERA